MKRLSGGNLRAAGYDERKRVLVVELTAGTFEYSGVTLETYRRVVAVEFLSRQYRRRVPRQAATLAALGGIAHIGRNYWTVKRLPATLGFFASLSSRTPFWYFASLLASSTSVGSVKLR